MEKQTYEEVRAEAQETANRTGYDRGLETSPYEGYRHFGLPRRENRYGHELRCEVVSCSDISRCQPGHGPPPSDARRVRMP